MSTKLISVIIPVYNGEQYIVSLIEKLLHNSYQNLEILIGNDASTDNTLLKLNQYKDHPRIKIINSIVNIGAGAMRNKLLNEAQGFYVAIQDADDDFEEDRFIKQADFLDNHTDIGVVGSGCVLRDPLTLSDWGSLKLKTTPGRMDWFLQRSMVHASVMMKKNLLGKNHYHPELKTGEDYYFLTSLYWAGVKFENLAEILYIYHIKRSDLKTRTRKRFKDILKSLPEIAKLFPLGTRCFFITLIFFKISYGVVKGMATDSK